MFWGEIQGTEECWVIDFWGWCCYNEIKQIGIYRRALWKKIGCLQQMNTSAI